jgi:FlaA1/EpsC-like NDP-sugar epimerase
MSVDEAVDLVIKTTEIAAGGETFILKMPVLRIESLLNVLIRKYAPKFGLDPTSIEVNEVGKKPGEKLNEELMTQEESQRAYENDEIFIVIPPFDEFSQSPEAYGNARKTSASAYTSNGTAGMSEKEIEEIIDSGKWFDEESL